WSAPVDTGLIAAQSSHNLLCTSRGLLVLTHNPSAPPLRTPLTMRVSADEGRTWGPPLTIAQVTPPAPDDPVWGRQVSYPSVAELPDGTLVVVWADLVLSNDHQSGVIRAARVQLDESAHPEHQESTQSN
ncbi:MAG TPA: sialidase family protein, partial [Phycisphaeraceae bacterium]